MILVSTVFFLAVGLIPAYLLCGGSILTIPLSGATAGLICAIAGMASITTRTALLPWVALSWAVAVGAAHWTSRTSRSRSEGDGSPRPARRADYWRSATSLAIIASIVSPTLLATRSAPIAWDARSIWFFHAQWFQAGGARAASSMANPAFAFAQADYPPLTAASTATLWNVYRGGDRWVALTINLWLTLSAVVLVGMMVTRLARARAQPPAALACGLLGLAMFGTAGGTATDGLVDLLWAAWLTAGAVTLLLLPTTRANQLTGMVCVSAASMTKAEGLAVGLLVVAAVTVRHRRHIRHATWAVLALAPALAWVALMRALGAHGTGALYGAGIRGLLRGDPTVLDRIGPTVSSLWSELAPLGAVATVLMALASFPLARHRHHLGLGLGTQMLSLPTVIPVIYFFVYVTGVFEIHWWLSSSLGRATIVVRTLLLTEIAIWLIVLIDLIVCGDKRTTTAPRKTGLQTPADLA